MVLIPKFNNPEKINHPFYISNVFLPVFTLKNKSHAPVLHLLYIICEINEKKQVVCINNPQIVSFLIVKLVIEKGMHAALYSIQVVQP